ncbi:MAG: hypothetical protein F4Y89_06090 [Gammaproteobacteria bacterium]|nr:hypothetical protein [Gammaproteobacteria bacterium]MYG96669.1 hypothetical protein [Gammaproteobacteria bacterium]
MSSVVDSLIVFNQANGLNLVLTVIAVVLTIVVINFVNLGSKDVYDVVKTKLRKEFSRKEATAESNGSTITDYAEDWSKNRAALELLKWFIGLCILFIIIKLPYTFMRPVFWNTAEILLYYYVLAMNLFAIITLGIMKYLFPNFAKEVLASYGSRKNKVKTLMSYAIIGFLVILLTEAMNDRYIYKSLAQQYCLSDMPGLTDRYIASLRLGIPVSEVLDEQVRDSMRNPLAEELISSETCSR